MKFLVATIIGLTVAFITIIASLVLSVKHESFGLQYLASQQIVYNMHIFVLALGVPSFILFFVALARYEKKIKNTTPSC